MNGSRLSTSTYLQPDLRPPSSPPFRGGNHKQVIEWAGDPESTCKISKCFRRRFSNGSGQKSKKKKKKLELIKINRKRFGTKNRLTKFMPRRSRWKGSFVDAFLLRKSFWFSNSGWVWGLRRPFWRLFVVPLSLKGGWRVLYSRGAPDRRRIIGTLTPGRVSEPCNRRPFRAVRGALESAAGARQRLDPYPIFGPIPSLYYQKMRFLPNPSLLLQPLPN